MLFPCFILFFLFLFFFFFNDPATTEIYTLSLHDALPIFKCLWAAPFVYSGLCGREEHGTIEIMTPLYSYKIDVSVDKIADRKSTRLNSSHTVISYAVFCLKKKKKKKK